MAKHVQDKIESVIILMTIHALIIILISASMKINVPGPGQCMHMQQGQAPKARAIVMFSNTNPSKMTVQHCNSMHCNIDRRTKAK